MTTMKQIDEVNGPNDTELRPGKGITVTYDEIPFNRRGPLFPSGWRLALLLFFALVLGLSAGAAGWYFHETGVFVSFVAIAIATIIAGLNTVTYDANGSIVAGTTAPTAQQSFNANTITAVITGDGATTTFTVTHNWAISASGITAATPWSFFEPLTVAFYTANPFLTARATNSVSYQCTAFSGAAFRVRLERPFSADDNQHF
jgi:hypothetical protein